MDVKMLNIVFEVFRFPGNNIKQFIWW